MNLAIKKVHPDAVLPKYAKQGDSGFDLVAVEDVIIEPGETKLVKTGLAFDIPEGYEIQVRPRSGITLKTKLRVQLGTVDSNYRGEVGVIVDNTEDDWFIRGTGYYKLINGESSKTRGGEEISCDSYIILKGDRIAQAILAPVTTANFIEVQELSESIRGTNGYGSTGIN
ncbi:dUTP diphosphatase [Microbulbifer pacificus]|uniref:dUTP diphosphatase n=1 Tax=Microbulbifer pacificus TaxID=407164 RepID=UPI000CF56A6A|nr:deoxyuridine 5'-triphosphate nucleotidohydrolase [Microbulbifer pacificus]